MLYGSGIITLILIHMASGMPRPSEEISTSTTTPSSVGPPDPMRICTEPKHCHCINGIPICYNSRCVCLYASAIDNLPANGTESLNESQYPDSPQ